MSTPITPSWNHGRVESAFRFCGSQRANSSSQPEGALMVSAPEQCAYSSSSMDSAGDASTPVAASVGLGEASELGSLQRVVLEKHEASGVPGAAERGSHIDVVPSVNLAHLSVLLFSFPTHSAGNRFGSDRISLSEGN
jgi:hypothetical protein